MHSTLLFRSSNPNRSRTPSQCSSDLFDLVLFGWGSALTLRPSLPKCLIGAFEAYHVFGLDAFGVGTGWQIKFVRGSTANIDAAGSFCWEAGNFGVSRLSRCQDLRIALILIGWVTWDLSRLFNHKRFLLPFLTLEQPKFERNRWNKAKSHNQHDFRLIFYKKFFDFEKYWRHKNSLHVYTWSIKLLPAARRLSLHWGGSTSNDWLVWIKLT